VQRIEAKPLHTEVAHRIREMIRKEILVEGQKISEGRLCEEMGVSRTPVREALRILSTESLVELVPRKGAFVCKPRMEEVEDMFQVMSVLEGVGSRLATLRMTDEDFRELEALHRQLELHYRNGDHRAYLEANHVFHQKIEELAGNHILNEVVEGLRKKILLHRQKQLFYPGRFSDSMNEHRELLEAFRRRDAPEAEELMKRHLLNQCKALVAWYDDQGASRTRGAQTKNHSKVRKGG